MQEPIFVDYNVGFDNTIFILSSVLAKNIILDTINVNISSDVKLKDIDNVVKLLKSSKQNIKILFGKSNSIINSSENEKKVDEKILDLIKEFDYETQNSPEVMINELKKSNKKVSLISTGSLSNIAKMLLACPEIKNNINKIIVVGGAIYGGNCTPCAEKNIFSDAYAADIVFNSGVPIVMCGLDVTEKACLSNKEIDEMIDAIKLSKNACFTDYVKNELVSMFESFKLSGKPLTNLCGIMYACNPEIFKSDKCVVSVETGGEFTYGCTVVDINHVLQENRNVDVLYSLDIKKFSYILKKIFN